MQESKFIQICFVVDDLDLAMRHHSDFFGAGPWFLTNWWEPIDDPSVYRGIKQPLRTRTALAYAGDMMFELVCPEANSQSIFTEVVERQGYGIHHYGFAVSNFEKAIRSVDTTNSEIAFSSQTPRGTRIAMVASRTGIGALKEFIEITPATEKFYDFMRRESERWDRETSVFAGTLPALD